MRPSDGAPPPLASVLLGFLMLPADSYLSPRAPPWQSGMRSSGGAKR
jgi:hypothetical protein